MPYKDPETAREKNAESMKRRREALKSEQFGESASQAAISVIEPPLVEKATPKPSLTWESNNQGELSSLVPPFIDAEKVELVDWGDNPEVRKIVNHWWEFPNEKGFPCCKDSGACCLPLIGQERELACQVTCCVFQPEVCAYHRGGNETRKSY